jgi:hypothetical protein
LINASGSVGRLSPRQTMPIRPRRQQRAFKSGSRWPFGVEDLELAQSEPQAAQIIDAQPAPATPDRS